LVDDFGSVTCGVDLAVGVFVAWLAPRLASFVFGAERVKVLLGRIVEEVPGVSGIFLVECVVEFVVDVIKRSSCFRWFEGYVGKWNGWWGDVVRYTTCFGEFKGKLHGSVLVDGV
jgi:hypothetical protein